MKAAVKKGRENYQIIEVPDLVPEKEEVLVKVAYCGICTWCYEVWESDAMERSLGPGETGHEVSGIVEKCGTKAKRYKPGDRVIIYDMRSCSGCPECLAGKDMYCKYAESLDHGYAEYVCVPERNVFPVPDNIPLKYAYMITDMIGTSLHAIKRAFSVPVPRDIITVWGLGPVGLFTVQCLRAMPDVKRIIALDPLEYRQKIALELGADAALSPAVPGFEDELISLYGATANYAFNCAIRDPDLIAPAFNTLGKNGYLMNITGVALSGSQLEKIVDGTNYYNRSEHAECLDLVTSGKVKLEPVLTDVYPLNDINDAMYKRLYHKNECLKIAIHCNSDID